MAASEEIHDVAEIPRRPCPAPIVERVHESQHPARLVRLARLFPAPVAHAAPPVMIMVIEPMSGPQSSTMEASAKNLQYAVKRDNDAGGVLDRKLTSSSVTTCSARKTEKTVLTELNGSITHFVMQGIGANVR